MTQITILSAVGEGGGDGELEEDSDDVNDGELDDGELDDDDCGEEEIDEDDSKSGNLSLLQRRSDRLFTQSSGRGYIYEPSQSNRCLQSDLELPIISFDMQQPGNITLQICRQSVSAARAKKLFATVSTQKQPNRAQANARINVLR